VRAEKPALDALDVVVDSHKQGVHVGCDHSAVEFTRVDNPMLAEEVQIFLAEFEVVHVVTWVGKVVGLFALTPSVFFQPTFSLVL
jgi:hypothetical protein